MSKRLNKRIARKTTLRWTSDSTKQSMSTAKRHYGSGKI
jgi:hypothetical protein